MTKYYILNGREVRPVELMEWAVWYETADRKVAKTQIGNVKISTVFLGMNHAWSENEPPLLFETMIFGGEFNDYQERYSTYDEAEKGHAKAVLMVEGKDNTLEAEIIE